MAEFISAVRAGSLRNALATAARRACGIVGIDRGPRMLVQIVRCVAQRNLVRHHVVGGVSLRHSLAQKLAKKYPRQGAYHQEYQSGDREHELGLQSHEGVTRNLLSTFERLAIGTCLSC